MFNSISKFQRFRDKRKWKIWQLFRATDFESLMYPCFTFCRILGIFPYKISASIIKIWKSCYILSAIFIFILCVYILMVLYDVNFNKNYIIKATPSVLQMNCVYILGGIIPVLTFILSGPQLRLLQTILELSLRLPQKSYQNLSILIHTKDVFVSLYMVVQFSIWWFMVQLPTYRKIFLFYIYLVTFQVDMLYMNCVCVLKACFKQVNDSLANLRFFMTNDEIFLLRGTYNEQRKPFILMEIKAIIKQHLAISDTVQMLNTVFSLQLLSSIIIAFTQITFNLYYCLIQIQKSVSSMDNLEREVYYETYVACVAYYSLKMILIVWACETGKNQAMATSTIVHDLFNGTSDKEIKYELHLFSLQLMHRKDTFSASALVLDATLLTSMTDNIATYLLILFQFLYMSDSCE